MDRDGFISLYHDLGFSQREILLFLAQNHGCVISQRHLRRILKAKGLHRSSKRSDIVNVATYVSRQLDLSGRQHGYRMMHLKCQLAGYTISREDVRILLTILDPEGVNLRKRRRLIRRRYITRGPNQIWHVDSYDKLSRYGIGINGCIDGYSRFIIWMEACYTNSDPKVIAGYFMRATASRRGCPRVIRADLGTENGVMRQIQLQLRGEHQDNQAGDKSFVYGKSTTNTRIESWWSILRKQNAQFWIELFRGLQEAGEFSGSALDKELIRFCFMTIIQVCRNQKSACICSARFLALLCTAQQRYCRHADVRRPSVRRRP